jgi:hypothetical protein
VPELRQLVDDSSVSDDDFVLRLIRPDTIDFDPPPRARSNAFQQHSEATAAEHGLAASCLSVSLESKWREAGGRVEDLLAQFSSSYGIVRLSVRKVRKLKLLSGEDQPQGVMRDPTSDQPWHAVVWDLSGKQSRGTMRALANLADDWLYLPPTPNESTREVPEGTQ